MSWKFKLVGALLPLAAMAANPRAAQAEDAPASANPIVERARLEVTRGVTYDSAWVAIPYPGGDPPAAQGVCTDVVVRSLRTVGVDLQKLIHEDIVARRTAYKSVAKVDRNIDHRRVTPMLTYMKAHATSLPTSTADPKVWQPGDVIVWALKGCPGPCTPDHVGVVSDRIGPRGLPLVLHNIGPAPSEVDALDAWSILGHFRVKVPAAKPSSP